MDLAALLVALKEDPHLSWLAAPLLQQVARALDVLSPPESFNRNPMEGAERTWGKEADLDLTLHLVQGLGQAGSSNEGGATFVEQHVAAFQKLRKTPRKWGKRGPPRPSVFRGTHSLLLRYRDAAKRFLEKCPRLCVALDASRVGGKDVLLVAILGTAEDGSQKAAWAPPQVPALGGQRKAPFSEQTGNVFSRSKVRG